MEEGRKQPRDLTEFFLEWRDTCSIDKCTSKADVRYVHDLFDNRLRLMIQSVRDSDLSAGVVSVSEFSGADVHAFHLVESEFYRPSEKPAEEGGKKYGQALKDHLFGNAATADTPGRLNRYFLLMLRSVANASFRGSVVSNPVPNDDGTPTDPLDTAPAPRRGPANDPTMSLAVKECLADFRKSLLAFWNGAAIDMRLAILCFASLASTHKVPFSNPAVVEASGLKSSAFAKRKELVVGKLREIAGALSDDYDPDDLQFVVGNHLWELVEEFGRGDPACTPFFEVA